MELYGYLASAIMGVTLGLLGGGGSILTVPIMVYLFHLAPSIATGYSLFVVGLTALIGSITYFRSGDFDFRTGVVFGTPSILGVYVSRAYIVRNLPNTVFEIGSMTITKDLLIMSTFALLMLLASYSMIRGRKIEKTENRKKAGSFVVIAISGFLVGIVAGFVGAGGGFLIIPTLVFIAKLGIRTAIGTSLMIIAFQSLLGFIGDLKGASPNWQFLLGVSAAAIFGIILGSRFSHLVPESKLKKAFGWFVLVMGTGILFEQIRQV